VRNRLLKEYLKEGPEPLAFPLQMLAMRDIYEEARARGEGDHFLLLAGQGLGMLKDGQGAAEIVAEIAAGAEATLARLTGEASAGAG
jgi:NAD(P)H-dependent flavin oxidoreductase YrpB (nitropropane dioxygenase family)